MSLKNYLLDSYFFFGLVLFTLGKTFDTYFIQIYILINLIGLILLVLQFLSLNLKLRISSIGIVIVSFLFYLIGNMFFISDINLGYLNLSDIFFIVQILLKQTFIVNSQGINSVMDLFKYITLINIFVILLSLFFSNLSNGYFLDIYYFTESMISMLFLIFLNLVEPKFFTNFSHIDLDFFFIGQLFWLIGDVFYSNIHLLNYNYVRDYSDIFFFVGFYFFVKSFSNLKYLINFNIVKI